MTGSMGAWLGRSGLAAALIVFPFSDLVLPVACGAGQGCWPPVTAAALAAVSAAAIIALASAGFLGRHVYDELLQDILDRTRANGWESVAALVPQAPLPPPVLLVDEADRRLDAAVQEARASAEAEVARITSEADERLAAAVHEARAAGAAKLADVQREAERLLAARVEQERAEAQLGLQAAVRDAQAAAAAELARVKQDAEHTLAARLKEALAEAAREREAAARKVDAAVIATTATTATTAATGSDVAPAPTAEADPKTQTSAPARKQTLEEHLEEARAQVARYRKSAIGCHNRGDADRSC